MLNILVAYSRATVCAVASVALATGCSTAPPPSATATCPSEVPPDSEVIVAVVADAYPRLRQPASVFLGADDVEDTEMAAARETLSRKLATTFRPPSERASGDPGASIALGRFNLAQDGRLSVVAGYVREEGGERGCIEYTLEREGENWVVVELVDVWPDCPISDQGELSYHVALKRTRGEDCFGLWANVGTCGQWLYVVETSGYGGTRYYFDVQTGLVVAQENFTDIAEEPERFVFGHMECEPEITETIVCDR